MNQLAKSILTISLISICIGCSTKPSNKITEPSPTPAIPAQNQEVPASAVTTMQAISSINPEDNISIAGDIVRKLSNQQYAQITGWFDTTMLNAFPPDKIEDVWKSIQAQVGSIQKTLPSRTEKYQQYDIVYVPCQFERGTLEVKIVFSAQHQVAGFFIVPPQASMENKPAAYVRESNFDEQEVTIGTGEWKLPGTLTLPKGSGPFPVLVLVHGSGPNDRDETLGPNKPFKDIAGGIASTGIACLRYEKRTKAYSAAMIKFLNTLTVKEETLDDVSAAVSFLKTQPKINPTRIYILGHSLGGMLIPRIAQSNPDAAGFIVLAGTTRPLEDVMLEQFHYLYSLQGNLTKEQQDKLNQIEDQIKQVKALNPSDTTSSSKMLFNAPASYWLDLKGYNPPEVAKSINKPMLILQGERDYQVTMVDFQNWKKALSAKPNVEFKPYPKLNHLFIEGENKSTPEEYNLPGHVAEYVINDISGWIMKQKI